MYYRFLIFMNCCSLQTSSLACCSCRQQLASVLFAIRIAHSLCCCCSPLTIIEHLLQSADYYWAFVAVRLLLLSICCSPLTTVLLSICCSRLTIIEHLLQSAYYYWAFVAVHLILLSICCSLLTNTYNFSRDTALSSNTSYDKTPCCSCDNMPLNV